MPRAGRDQSAEPGPQRPSNFLFSGDLLVSVVYLEGERPGCFLGRVDGGELILAMAARGKRSPHRC